MAKAGEDEQQPRDSLTDSDRMELDELVDERRHRRWLWALVRRWTAWIVAVLVGLPTVVEALSKLGKYIK